MLEENFHMMTWISMTGLILMILPTSMCLGMFFPAPLPMLNLVYLKVICYLRPEKGNMFSATQSTLILSKT